MATSPGLPVHRAALSVARRIRLCAVLGSVALWGMGSSALAQESAQCDSLLEEAEQQYVSLAFVEAENFVRDCLALSDVEDEEALKAYRLLALVNLRQDDLSEAKEAVLRLLGISFDYTPDAVQDPPAYVALVTSVKDQLRVARSSPTDSVRVAALPPEDPASDAEPDTGADIQIVRNDPNPPEDTVPTATRVPTRKKSGVTRWLMIGGGVLAAGLVAVMLTSGDSPSGSTGGSTPLPPPPSFPR